MVQTKRKESKITLKLQTNREASSTIEAPNCEITQLLEKQATHKGTNKLIKTKVTQLKRCAN